MNEANVKELMSWVSTLDGITMSPGSVARAFWRVDLKTVPEVVNYLLGDKDCAKRPKGIGEDNYKKLQDHAKKYSESYEPTFVGLTCSNGVSFAGRITKQDYAEFCGVIEALQIWFETHKIGE